MYGRERLDIANEPVQVGKELVDFGDVQFVVFRAGSQVVLAAETLINAVVFLQLLPMDEQRPVPLMGGNGKVSEGKTGKGRAGKGRAGKGREGKQREDREGGQGRAGKGRAEKGRAGKGRKGKKREESREERREKRGRGVYFYTIGRVGRFGGCLKLLVGKGE